MVLNSPDIDFTKAFMKNEETNKNQINCIIDNIWFDNEISNKSKLYREQKTIA
jgi:hypothetical protein